MTDRIQTTGEIKPGSADPELATRIAERKDAFRLLGDAILGGFPVNASEVLNPYDLARYGFTAPVAEEKSMPTNPNAIAQFSANAALAQQVDGPGL